MGSRSRNQVLVVLAAAAVTLHAGGALDAGEQASEKELGPEAKKRLEESRQRRAAERERRLRERILTARELEKTVDPWVPDISACYKKHGLVHKRATGILHIEVLVEPGGRVRRMHVVAPGVRGKKLATCVETIGDKWLFATRKGFTNATIPFKFLQTKAKGAGPLQSCWSRSGCSKSKRRARADKSSKKKAAK